MANSDPTVAVAPPAPPQTQPQPPYASDPYYNVPAQNYYPYNAPPPIVTPPFPPPTPGGKGGGMIGLIIGLVLLAVIVGGGSFFLITKALNPGGNQTNTVTPTAQTDLQPTQAPTPTVPPQATPIPTPTDPNQNPYPPQTGTLVMSDPMHDNSKGSKWDEQSFKGTNGDTSTYNCGFSGGAYHITASANGLWCNPEAPTLVFSNVALEAKLTIIKGDRAGLAVRVDQKANTSYTFLIDTSGSYILEAYSPKSGFSILRQGADAAIKTGLNQTNLLALVVNGTTFSGYVNDQLVATVQDSTYASGQIGVYGEGVNQASDIVASDARVWKI